MVLVISIVLYHTIKILVAKKKGCISDKTDPFRKCRKSLLGHTNRHMCVHTHTPEMSIYSGHLVLDKT